MGSRLECALCGGAYNVEGSSEDGSHTRVKCADCGHTDEVAVARVQPPATGKWTVIDPSGAVRSFETVEELMAHQASAPKDAEPAPPAPAPELEPVRFEATAPPKEPSPAALESSAAAAILDDMPSQPLSVVPGRLEIVESETDLSKHDRDDDDAPPVSSKDIDASLVESVPPASTPGEEHPLSVRDLQVVPVPKLPSSSIAPKPSAQVSIPPPLPEKARSLRPTAKPSKASEPPPAKDEPTTIKSATRVEATKKDEPKKEEPKKEPPKKSAEPKKPQKPPEMKHEDFMKPSIAPAASAEPTPEAKNGWVTPALAVAAILIAVWFVTKGSSNAASDTPTKSTSTPATNEAPSATPSASTAATTPSESPSASGSAAPATSAQPTASGAPSEKVAAPKLHPKPGDSASPAASASAQPEATANREPTTVAELLDHAAKARRAGDPARARELYDRVLASSPSNVEALYGLGNVARAEGNLAGAKAAYQKAVAANGSFFPALLGLADAEWDSGDKASAKAHYAQLYKSSPASAPPRAKERAEITE